MGHALFASRPLGVTTAAALAGRAVLVVEDEFLVALALEDMLVDLGCRVVGPAASLAEALRLAEDARFDVAVLDVNLGRDQTSMPVAAALARICTPFVFATGYGPAGVDAAFRDRPILSKPLLVRELVLALTQALVAGRRADEDPALAARIAAGGAVERDGAAG
jgi:CheY-like chemotaxis protein